MEALILLAGVANNVNTCVLRDGAGWQHLNSLNVIYWLVLVECCKVVEITFNIDISYFHDAFDLIPNKTKGLCNKQYDEF